MNDEELKKYMPQYLSTGAREDLVKEIRNFPNNIDERMYASLEPEIIYQGDGVGDMLVINLPDKKILPSPAMILSNTCDIDLANKRRVGVSIMYAPIARLEAYKKMLETEKVFSTQNDLNNHLASIKKQEITNIFFLPKANKKADDEDVVLGMPYEGIAFLDKACSCDNDSVKRTDLNKRRLFSLSDYGFYMFLLKISIHLTRIHEKVERGQNHAKAS